MYQSLEKTIEVKKGDIKVNVIGTGSIVLKDEENSNLNELKLKIQVDELEVGKLKVGQLAEVKIDAYQNEIINGKVISIANKGEVTNGIANYTVEISLPKLVNETAKIKYDGINLRKGPSQEYMTIKTLNQNDSVNILKSENSWYNISTKDGLEGWIYSDYIVKGELQEKNLQATVVKETVNVRTGASPQYSYITKIIKNDMVNIVDKNNNWYKVKLSNNQEGWVEESDISFEKIKPGMSATASICVEDKKDVLYLPIECIKKVDDSYGIILGGKSDITPIKIGSHSDEYTEIIEGVSEGDKVKIPSEEIVNLN